MSRTKFILALDVDSFNEAMELVKELKGIVDIFKVGSQLFTSCGPTLIDAIHDEASEVFLDLITRCHDTGQSTFLRQLS